MDILYIFMLFLTSIFEVADSVLIPCSTTGNLSETIDSTRFQCCRGKVEMLQPGKECCYEAAEFYFSKLTVCCNGSLVSRPESGSISCCANEIINDTTHICCNNTKQTLPKGLDRTLAACCGRIPFNITKQFCCGNNPNSLTDKKPKVHCCRDQVIDKDTHWCDLHGHSLPKYYSMCGSEKISLLEKSCCNDVSNNVPYYKSYRSINEHYDCCNDKPMNKTSEKCCNNGIIITTYSDDIDCCGKGTYNKTSEMCCYGVAISRSNGVNQCCGSNAYNNRDKGCCSDQLIDRKSQKCCRGRHSVIVDIDDQCCGDTLLTNDSLCCRRSYPVKKTHPEDDKCCLHMHKSRPIGTSYDSSIKGCRNGYLYTKEENMRICGDTVIDTTKHICCNNKQYPISEGKSMRCCGIKPFDINKQICCHGNIFNISAKYGRCCNGKGYKLSDLPKECRTSLQVELNYLTSHQEIVPTAYPTTKPTTNTLMSACNGVEYDKLKYLCCQNKLFSKKNGKTCCSHKTGRGSRAICTDSKNNSVVLWHTTHMHAIYFTILCLISLNLL